MKTFHCGHCGQLLFFENVQCVRCGHTLAYLPDFRSLASVEIGPDGAWQAALPDGTRRTYRPCVNYVKENVCNWLVAANDPQSLCVACRFTRITPNLSEPKNRTAWYRLEVAKRRLIYTLRTLDLPLQNRSEDSQGGLGFEFLADEPAAPALTGHKDGVITINIAEADDAEREKRRTQFHEPYRTLLGHFRHESGHYYWDRLIKGSPWIDRFRATFGDEQQDYGAAIAQHHEKRAPADWQQRFVSAYASAHPWEDWAETWAHFLHMSDALETAADCGVSLQPRRADEPRLDKIPAPKLGSFDKTIADWFSLAYLLNNLNRGLGWPDSYPFVLSTPVIDKLRFIHDVVAQAAHGSASSA